MSDCRRHTETDKDELTQARRDTVHGMSQTDEPEHDESGDDDLQQPRRVTIEFLGDEKLISDDLRRTFDRLAEVAEQILPQEQRDRFAEISRTIAESPGFAEVRESMERIQGQLQVTLDDAQMSAVGTVVSPASVRGVAVIPEPTVAAESVLTHPDESADDLQWQMFLYFADWARRQESLGPKDVLMILTFLMALHDAAKR